MKAWTVTRPSRIRATVNQPANILYAAGSVCFGLGAPAPLGAGCFLVGTIINILKGVRHR